MANDEWVALIERVLRTLGEVSPDHVVSAEFRVRLHELAAASEERPAPGDGRPKIFTLTVTTSG